ncbi:MAG: dockerin type I domain-containing protein [Candidatus Zixiibacteriota bacterium]
MVYDSTNMVLDDPLNLLVDSKEWLVKVAPWSYLCGDPTKDSTVSVSDVIFMINYLFKGGPEPFPLASGDVNLDYKVTVSDVIYMINYIFKGGLEPCHI